MYGKISITEMNLRCLEQGIVLVRRISDRQYTRKNPPLHMSSVGSHLRHVQDHYLSFLDGLERGCIDYEARKRDPLFEDDRDYAVQRMRETIHRLEEACGDDVGKQLMIRLEGCSAVTRAVWAPSSLRRELDFLLSHTIHHYGLIAMILRLQHADPGWEFGIAPSTLRFLQGTSPCAQ